MKEAIQDIIEMVQRETLTFDKILLLHPRADATFEKYF